MTTNLIAAIERADVYHGLRWRAFAFGVAISGAVIALGGALRPWLVPFLRAGAGPGRKVMQTVRLFLPTRWAAAAE